MALFSPVSIAKYFPREVPLFPFWLCFSAEFTCARHSPTNVDQARRKHSDSSQAQQNDQIRQILDRLGKVHTEMASHPLATSQQQIAAQLSNKLIQLALTATNLANDLLQKNGVTTADHNQLNRPMKMDQPQTSTFEPKKMKSDGGKQRTTKSGKGAWICVNCGHRNSMLRFECQSCEKGLPTEAQRKGIRRALAGVWQCVSCNKINGRLNKVCFECGAAKGPLKMAAAQTNRENGTDENFTDKANQRETDANYSQTKTNDKTDTAAVEEDNGGNFAQQKRNAIDAEAQKEHPQNQRNDGKSKLGTMFFGVTTEEKQAMAK